VKEALPALELASAMLALHTGAAEEVRRLHVLHAPRLQCANGCSSCCVDDLSVFEVEADVIRGVHGAWLKDAVPHADGGCAFLSETSACRIYDERPYACRTQGLPLRWISPRSPEQALVSASVFEIARDPELVEQRDICPLNDLEGDEQALLRIDAVDCWTLGPFEESIALLELSRVIPRPRVTLRSLFTHKSVA
jgi:uncharacterized protein